MVILIDVFVRLDIFIFYPKVISNFERAEIGKLTVCVIIYLYSRGWASEIWTIFKKSKNKRNFVRNQYIELIVFTEKHIHAAYYVVFDVGTVGLHDLLHPGPEGPPGPGDILPVQEGELLHDGGPEGVEVGAKLELILLFKTPQTG